MKTQVQHVLDHLNAGKSITPSIAMTVYGIYRLSSVIEDLRNAGYEIDCVIKHDEMGKKYGEYRFRKPIVVGSGVQIRRGFGILLPNWVRRTKVAKVIAKQQDTSFVRFIRGRNLEDHWVNDKELVNAD